MSCFHPRRVFFTGRVNPETKGKETIFADFSTESVSLEHARRKYKDLQPNETMQYLNGRWFLTQSVAVPCGRCEGCKFAAAKQWALRCLIESRKYDYNFFLTLTYDDVHLPFEMKKVKEDLQAFMKVLRAHYGSDIKFFACGEVGGSTLRFHAHMILFNCNINDLVRYDQDYTTSDTINRLWHRGNVLIGPVTAGTCAYVARYTAKKKNREFGEFLLMSRRPGIGYDYWKDHGDMIADDKLYFSDGNKAKHSVPRYYKYLHRKEDRETADATSGRNSMSIIEQQSLSAFMAECENIEQYLEKQEEKFLHRDKCKRNKL